MRLVIDARDVLGTLDAFERRQLPYAEARAINRLAEAFQERQRQHMRQTFELRRETFVLRGIKITQFADKRQPQRMAVIQVAYPDDRHFLDQHEQGDTRIPHGRFLWQPSDAVFKGKVIGKGHSLHPKNLAMTKGKGASRTFMVRKGEQRLVIQRTNGPIPRERGEAGRFKTRTNRRRKGKTRLLYRLVTRVRIPARLEFVATAGRTLQAQGNQALYDAMMQALYA